MFTFKYDVLNKHFKRITDITKALIKLDSGLNHLYLKNHIANHIYFINITKAIGCL